MTENTATTHPADLHEVESVCVMYKRSPEPHKHTHWCESRLTERQNERMRGEWKQRGAVWAEPIAEWAGLDKSLHWELSWGRSLITVWSTNLTQSLSPSVWFLGCRNDSKQRKDIQVSFKNKSKIISIHHILKGGENFFWSNHSDTVLVAGWCLINNLILADKPVMQNYGKGSKVTPGGQYDAS